MILNRCAICKTVISTTITNAKQLLKLRKHCCPICIKFELLADVK